MAKQKHRGKVPALEAYQPRITIIRQNEGKVTIFDGPKQIGVIAEHRIPAVHEALNDWLNENTRNK